MAAQHTPVVSPLGESALLLGFGERIDERSNARVLAVWRELRERMPAGVLDLVPAYASLGVFFDPCRADVGALRALLLELAQRHAGAEPRAGRRVEIPVCYEPACAPDLEAVCAHTGFDAAEVVRRHTAPDYRVHFLGFAPGFPYLGGMDPALATPRRATPRTRVPPGAVGIGGSQTGVYPLASPGGWQLIGRTALALFDPPGDPPCLLAPGDAVRFVAVPREALGELEP